MELRSLPIREPPIADESLTSFVRRHAVAMGYESLERLLSLADEIEFPPHLDHLHRGPPLDELARLLRCAPETLLSMTVHRFAPRLVLRHTHSVPASACDLKSRQRFFTTGPLRVCAKCLMTSVPYEPLLWSFRPLAICLKHRTYFIMRCPMCNRTLRASRLELDSCICGSGLTIAKHVIASPEVQKTTQFVQELLLDSTSGNGNPAAAAQFAWLDRLRSAVLRSPEWLLRARHALDLPTTLDDDSVAWTASVRIVADPHKDLHEFLDTYQTVAKHRSTSTGINRAFGFLLRDAARLERRGYPEPAEQLRHYLLENYTHGHLSGKTTLFRTPLDQRQLRTRAWLTQTDTARELGIRPKAVSRLIRERVLMGRVESAGKHGRTIGLVSRESVACFARQLSTHLTLEQVAARLGISRHRVSEFITHGLLIGSVRVSRSWRIPAAALEQLLACIDRLPVVATKREGWLSLREATRQFGPSGINLARIVQLLVGGGVSGQRCGNFPGLRSVHVSAEGLDKVGSETVVERAIRQGWSLQMLAAEIFPEKRFKDVVIRKWIEAGLLSAIRRANRWHIAHEAVVRFRREYCLAQEACRILAISRGTLARWETEGRITAVYGRRSHRGAGASLFRRSDLERLSVRPVA